MCWRTHTLPPSWRIVFSSLTSGNTPEFYVLEFRRSLLRSCLGPTIQYCSFKENSCPTKAAAANDSKSCKKSEPESIHPWIKWNIDQLHIQKQRKPKLLQRWGQKVKSCQRSCLHLCERLRNYSQNLGAAQGHSLYMDLVFLSKSQTIYAKGKNKLRWQRSRTNTSRLDNRGTSSYRTKWCRALPLLPLHKGFFTSKVNGLKDIHFPIFDHNGRIVGAPYGKGEVLTNNPLSHCILKRFFSFTTSLHSSKDKSSCT